jgi:hypothetical protein
MKKVMPQISKSLASAILGFSLLAALSVNAAENTRKMALATELTELMQVRHIASGYLAHCSKQEGAYLDPKRLFTSDPSLFGGVSPQSAYWPEVVELYGKYQAKACLAVSADKFARFFAEQYEAKLSETDLEAAVAFFSSAAGQRYNSASAETNLAFQAYLTKEMTRVVSDAFKEVQQDLRAISLKYKNDPK